MNTTFETTESDWAEGESEQAACIDLTVPNELAGTRLDAALAKLLPDYSRSRITSWIKDGLVQCNGQTASPKHKLIGGELLRVQIQPSDENQAFEPEAMDLDIVYEDDSVIVLNKPAGLVVHPAAGNWTGTLLNGRHRAPLRQRHQRPDGGGQNAARAKPLGAAAAKPQREADLPRRGRRHRPV